MWLRWLARIMEGADHRNGPNHDPPLTDAAAGAETAAPAAEYPPVATSPRPEELAEAGSTA